MSRPSPEARNLVEHAANLGMQAMCEALGGEPGTILLLIERAPVPAGELDSTTAFASDRLDDESPVEERAAYMLATLLAHAVEVAGSIGHTLTFHGVEDFYGGPN